MCIYYKYVRKVNRRHHIGVIFLQKAEDGENSFYIDI